MVKHGKTTVAVIFRLKRFKKSNKTFIFASAAGCYLSTLFWSTSSARETEGLEETPSASSWVSHSEKKKFTNINLAHDFSHHLISCWLLCYTYHLESISMTVCDGIHQGGLRCETTWQFDFHVASPTEWWLIWSPLPKLHEPLGSYAGERAWFRMFGQTFWRLPKCSRRPLCLTIATGARNITGHSIWRCFAHCNLLWNFLRFSELIECSIQPATKRCIAFVYLEESVQF